MQSISLLFNLSLLLWLAAMIFTYIKFNKEYGVSFHEKYYRVPPADYPPGEMSLLVYYDKTHPRHLMATLLNLVRKDYLVINREKEDFILEYGSNKNREALHSHEAYLLDWFMDGHDRIYISDLADIPNDRKKAIEFTKNYKNWRAALKKDAALHHFFDNSTIAKALGGAVALLFIILSVLLMLNGNRIRFVIAAGLGVITALYSCFAYKRSLKGQEEYEKWMAFKRFLKDFTVEDCIEDNSIVTWEKYLIYAVSLGAASEVVGKLSRFFGPEEWENPNLKLLSVFYNKEQGLTALEEMISATIKAMKGALILTNGRI